MIVSNAWAYQKMTVLLGGSAIGLKMSKLIEKRKQLMRVPQRKEKSEQPTCAFGGKKIAKDITSCVENHITGISINMSLLAESTTSKLNLVLRQKIMMRCLRSRGIAALFVKNINQKKHADFMSTIVIRPVKSEGFFAVNVIQNLAGMKLNLKALKNI